MGFPDLWSGKIPRWNWYLTPVVNFSVVRRAQLAEFTLLTSTLVPLRSFQMLKESGVRKATGCYRIYSSLVKLQLWFLNLQSKTCPWAENWWYINLYGVYLNREWDADNNGKLPHLFIPSKIATWVPEFAYRTAPLVTAFAIKDLPFGNTLWWGVQEIHFQLC